MRTVYLADDKIANKTRFKSAKEYGIAVLNKQEMSNDTGFRLLCANLLTAAEEDTTTVDFARQYSIWREDIAKAFDGDWKRWWLARMAAQHCHPP